VASGRQIIDELKRDCRCELGGVEFKPRDLGSDRGYRVDRNAVVVVVWVGLNLNPHPLRAKGAAPKGRLLEFGVFGFGLLECGEGGVGVFPEGEESFVGGEGAGAG
jgi:hypothetical protein